MSFWLPIPVGFASYARLEWTLRHKTHEPHPAAGEGPPHDPAAAQEPSIGALQAREDGG
jgi:hypothetical protein